MILYLECRSYGISLDIPTTRDEAASTIFSLIAGFEDEPAEISISGVNSPIPSLYPYIQHADLESGADIEKLNTLDDRINGMTQEEQRLFSGALELECTGDLDFTVHVANSLDRYEIFPKIKTDEDLGRFLVDTAFITGKFRFPEEARPYLDYAKIGAEQRDALGGCIHGPWFCQTPGRSSGAGGGTKSHASDTHSLRTELSPCPPRLREAAGTRKEVPGN